MKRRTYVVAFAASLASGCLGLAPVRQQDTDESEAVVKEFMNVLIESNTYSDLVKNTEGLFHSGTYPREYWESRADLEFIWAPDEYNIVSSKRDLSKGEFGNYVYCVEEYFETIKIELGESVVDELLEANAAVGIEARYDEEIRTSAFFLTVEDDEWVLFDEKRVASLAPPEPRTPTFTNPQFC